MTWGAKALGRIGPHAAFSEFPLCGLLGELSELRALYAANQADRSLVLGTICTPLPTLDTLRKRNQATFAFFRTLCSWGLLKFHMNFVWLLLKKSIAFFSVSAKNANGVLTGMAMNLWITLGNFNNIKSSSS